MSTELASTSSSAILNADIFDVSSWKHFIKISSPFLPLPHVLWQYPSLSKIYLSTYLLLRHIFAGNDGDERNKDNSSHHYQLGANFIFERLNSIETSESCNSLCYCQAQPQLQFKPQVSLMSLSFPPTTSVTTTKSSGDFWWMDRLFCLWSLFL